MKKILLLFIAFMTTIASIGQIENANDCPIREYTSDYDRIDVKSENIYKTLKDYLDTKKQLKGEIETFLSQNNTNSLADDYNKFKLYLNTVINSERFVTTNLNFKDSITIRKEVYLAIIGISDIILRNNLDTLYVGDDRKINEKKEASKLGNVLLTQVNFRVDMDTLNNTLYYITASNSYSKFLSSLYKIKSTHFNSCLTKAYSSLENINNDIQNAEKLLQEVTSKDLYELKFKKNITLIVGVLIAIILICFFVGTLYKANEVVKQKLLGEAGLQFITIFVIIIAVILFGVMNILKGSELAAILSAIAGYILGKTAPPKSEKTLEIELDALKHKTHLAQLAKEEREAAEKKRKEEELAAATEEKPIEANENSFESQSQNQNQEQGGVKTETDKQASKKAGDSDGDKANGNDADQKANKD